SYYVEKLTDEIAHIAWTLIKEVGENAVMTKAIEKGIPKMRLEEAAAKNQARIDNGHDTIVGVNRYRREKEDPIVTLEVDNQTVRKKQLERLDTLRKNRDENQVDKALARLTDAAKNEDGNLLALAIDAARA